MPLLERHDERVQQSSDESTRNVVARDATVTNGYGWTAGRTAADLALLDTRRPLTRVAG